MRTVDSAESAVKVTIAAKVAKCNSYFSVDGADVYCRAVASAPAPHPDLPFKDDDFAIDPKDWLPALILQADLELELAEKRNHLLRRLSTWYSLITIFRRLERDRMVASEPTARDRKYHRAMLEFLIGSGAVLLLELECHKQIDSIHIGIPFESVAAQLQELRDNLRMWHGDMTPARRAEILGDVFGVKE